MTALADPGPRHHHNNNILLGETDGTFALIILLFQNGLPHTSIFKARQGWKELTVSSSAGSLGSRDLHWWVRIPFLEQQPVLLLFFVPTRLCCGTLYTGLGGTRHLIRSRGSDLIALPQPREVIFLASSS